MPCPFPGMDPLIEADNWQHFHLSLTAEITRIVGPQLPDHYRISSEIIGFVENREQERTSRRCRPDIGVSTTGDAPDIVEEGGIATLLTPPSRKFDLAAPKQREIRIFDRNNNRLVTAIEVLSPSNKWGVGRRDHRQKLRDYHRADVHTIDIDLLRGGTLDYHPVLRSETGLEDAQTPYHVVLVQDRFHTAIWDLTLTDRLPTVPVPLLYPDPSVVLDLQRAFTELYRYSTYPKRKKVDLATLQPPLTEAEQQQLSTYLKP